MVGQKEGKKAPEKQEGTKQTVAILGSTGSIGTSAAQIIRQNNQLLGVKLLMASGNKVDEIIQQCNQLQPEYLFLEKADKVEQAKLKLQHQGGQMKKIKVNKAEDLPLVIENEGLQVDITIGAISGFAGVAPTIAMAGVSNRLAIANKEAIICAWELLSKTAQNSKCQITPIDSEHNSLFQIMGNSLSSDNQEISKITITASGGPFLNYKGNLNEVTPQMALNHPKWKMGFKNSIDSATLANKGLEIMEACLLFNKKEEEVEEIIHPQAIVHAIVSYKSGASFAFMSNASMLIHIANAIMPAKTLKTGVEPINLALINQLQFIPIDNTRFPAVQIAKEATRLGRASMFAYSGANEVAVQAFMEERISFTQISKVIEGTITKFGNAAPEDIRSINLFHQEVTQKAKEEIESLGQKC